MVQLAAVPLLGHLLINKGFREGVLGREDRFLFVGRDDCQQMLVIQITAIPLASDSSITILRFHPSKDLDLWPEEPHFDQSVSYFGGGKSPRETGPSLGFSKVIIWAKFVFFLKTLLAQKHYKNRGFSTFFLKKKCAQKFAKLLSGPSWPFLCCNKLGPDNNINLAQIITLQNGHFFFFLLLKMCWNTYFYSVFWTSTKIWPKKGQKKTITFHIFQNTGY